MTRINDTQIILGVRGIKQEGQAGGFAFGSHVLASQPEGYIISQQQLKTGASSLENKSLDVAFNPPE